VNRSSRRGLRNRRPGKDGHIIPSTAQRFPKKDPGRLEFVQNLNAYSFPLILKVDLDRLDDLHTGRAQKIQAQSLSILHTNSVWPLLPTGFLEKFIGPLGTIG